jgi:argininosuccinate lyase
MQLWQGRFQKALDPKTNDFNSSIAFDSRMYKDDIDGSIAHATMLCAQNIISADDLSKIVDGLKAIKAEIENGTLEIDPNAEDIHTFGQALTAYYCFTVNSC